MFLSEKYEKCIKYTNFQNMDAKSVFTKYREAFLKLDNVTGVGFSDNFVNIYISSNEHRSTVAASFKRLQQTINEDALRDCPFRIIVMGSMSFA
jgi:hypothetical protein